MFARFALLLGVMLIPAVATSLPLLAQDKPSIDAQIKKAADDADAVAKKVTAEERRLAKKIASEAQAEAQKAAAAAQTEAQKILKEAQAEVIKLEHEYEAKRLELIKKLHAVAPTLGASCASPCFKNCKPFGGTQSCEQYCADTGKHIGRCLIGATCPAPECRRRKRRKQMGHHKRHHQKHTDMKSKK